MFVYTGITVRDLDRSIKFYTEVMGLELIARIKNPYTDGEFAELKSAENDLPGLELNWYRDQKEFRNGDELDHLRFLVRDAKAKLERLRSLGVEIAQEPFESPNHTVFFAKDPDGIRLEIFSKKRPDAFPAGIEI